MEPCRESDCPLMVRLRLGPNEDIAKIFVMEVSHAEEMKISAEVREACDCHVIVSVVTVVTAPCHVTCTHTCTRNCY